MAMKKAVTKKVVSKKVVSKKGDEPVRAGVKKKQGAMRGAIGATGGSDEANINAKINKLGVKKYGFRSGGKNRNPIKNFSLGSGQGIYLIPDPKRPQKGSAGAKKR